MFTMVKLMSFDVAYHQLALLMQKKRAYQEVFSLLDTLFLCSANPYPFSVITEGVSKCKYDFDNLTV